MSLTKQEVATSDYIKTGSKVASKGTAKRVAIKNAQELSSGRLMWILITRHKVALLALGNIILVLNTVFPPWFDMLKSVF